MPTSAERIQVLFEIAVSIGKSTNLQKMLKDSLSKIVRLLNCSAGGVLQVVKDSEGKVSLESVRTIPINTNSILPYQRALKRLSLDVDSNTIDQFFQGPPICDSVPSAGHYYCLPLPSFGVLVIVRGENPLDPITLKSLSTITEHLASACLACIQSEKIERSREELAEANKQLLKHDEILRERENELSLITESTMDTIFLLTNTGRIQYLSPAVKELIGYAPDELIGKFATEFLPKGEIPGYIKMVKEIFKNRRIIHYESTVQHRNGHIVPIEMNGQLVRKGGELLVGRPFN